MNLPEAPTHFIWKTAPNTPIIPKEELEDIPKIISQIDNINAILTKQIAYWKKNTKYCSSTKSSDLANLCKTPTQTIQKIDNELIQWLKQLYYIKTGKLVPSSQEYFSFMKRGLNIIYNFTVVAPYLINDGELFVPPQPSYSVSEWKQEVKKFQKTLINLIVEIVGCSSKFYYQFLYDFRQMPQFKQITDLHNKQYDPNVVKKINAIDNVCTRFSNL